MKFGKYIIAAMLFVSLCGCGKKPVEYVGENTEAEDINVQESGQNEDGDASGMPEKLNYTIQNTDGHVYYNIDANVGAVGLDDAGIYKAEFAIVDDAYLHTLSASVFDDEAYYIMKPYYASSMEELLEEQERLKAAAGTEGAYSVPLIARQEELESAIASYSASNEELAEYFDDDNILYQQNHIYSGDYEGAALYTNELTAGPYTGHNVYQMGVLRGEIDGELYELNAHSYSRQDTVADSAETYTMYNAGYSLTSLSNNAAVCNVAPLNDKTEEEYGGNSCNIDSAEKKAGHMLSVLGLTDFEKADTLHIVSGTQADHYLDGYCFTYVYMLDGIMGNCFESAVTYGETDGIEKNSYIKVYVNSGGVAYVVVCNPVVAGQKQENINLKSFSEIDEAARNVLFGNVEYMEDEEKYTIYAVKLMYGLYSADGVNYEIRPMWVYYGIVDNMPKDDNHICVMLAIDAVSGDRMPGTGYEMMFEYFSGD